MKLLSILFMVVAVLSLIIGAILRIPPATIKGVPPQSFLEFTIACLLFAIATSVYVIADKK